MAAKKAADQATSDHVYILTYQEKGVAYPTDRSFCCVAADQTAAIGKLFAYCDKACKISYQQLSDAGQELTLVNEAQSGT